MWFQLWQNQLLSWPFIDIASFGLVVKASALRTADPGFNSCLCHRNFFGSGRTSDLKICTPGLLCQVRFTLWAWSVRFGGPFYAFTLDLPDFTLFSGRVSNFGLCTIDLCDKSCRFSAAEWRIWKTCFGWLPHLQDPINIKLTRILRECEHFLW